MSLFATVALEPGGVIAWLLVGLIAGFLASRVMGAGGYGLVGDIVVGLIGAFIGWGHLRDVRGGRVRHDRQHRGSVCRRLSVDLDRAHGRTPPPTLVIDGACATSGARPTDDA